MSESPQDYHRYVEALEEKQHQQAITHTIYLSRRAIWVNFLFCFLLSPLAGYIHTRRWKALGIFTIFLVGFSILTSQNGESFGDSFKRGGKFCYWFGLIAFVDNSKAIRQAQEKVNNQI
jgi:hypothetical protein